MVMMIAARTKAVSYHNPHLEDDFILLATEIFGCLLN
jgi:hypothetical protein